MSLEGQISIAEKEAKRLRDEGDDELAALFEQEAEEMGRAADERDRELERVQEMGEDRGWW